MIVYHVTSLKKLNKYIESGMILPPVRAWEDIEQAERMSISTGRKNEHINRQKDYFKIAFPGQCRKIRRTFQSGKSSL